MGFDKDERDFFVRLGRRIKQLRQERGLTQEDMEEHGLAYKYYQRIESPGSRPANITLRTLLKICRALDCEPRDLFQFDD
jgi:DNA-binding Xre family transcriptional regulator